MYRKYKKVPNKNSNHAFIISAKRFQTWDPNINLNCYNPSDKDHPETSEVLGTPHMCCNVHEISSYLGSGFEQQIQGKL